jgi:hypothetical protein
MAKKQPKVHSPAHPEAIKNILKYRPPTAIVARETTYPTMTTHHHPVMWKKRSPDLSGVRHNVSMKGDDVKETGRG